MHNAMPSRGADVQPYKYNGKELDIMHSLLWEIFMLIIMNTCCF